jgi:hypothetical protein
MTLTPEQRSVLTPMEATFHFDEPHHESDLDGSDLVERLATARLERDAARFECECLREAFREWNNFDSATCFQYLVGAATCPAFIAERVRAKAKEQAK